jgi:hypothetical protein
MDTINNRWRFDGRSHRWIAKAPAPPASPLFIKTVVLLFFAGCVLEFFR